jgi:hypothetical protein
MKIRFVCPECSAWTQTEQVEAAAWTCSTCGAVVPAAAPPKPGANELTVCRCCGNHELYLQKDFPHWLGMGILVAACAASAVTYWLYWITTTWVILIGSAVLDGVLYLVVGSVTICYRCQAQYRDFPPNPAHQPFELSIWEKYRQERLRRQQLDQP